MMNICGQLCFQPTRLSKFMGIVKIIALVIAAVCVLFFLLGLWSQKGEALGLVSGKLAPCTSKPNCVSSEAETQPEKLVKPLSGTLKQAKAAVIATGGIITSETDRYISATYMSKTFKFIDDVELRAEGNQEVHIRSGSRVGYSDRGANRKRVAAIRAALHK